jgi:hypothetical protein
MIDPTFSSTQQQAIKDQLAKWKNAGGANVTFNYVTPSTAGNGACCGDRPIYTVLSKVPTNSGAGAQGETRGFSNGSGNRGDSTTEITPASPTPRRSTNGVCGGLVFS